METSPKSFFEAATCKGLQSAKRRGSESPNSGAGRMVELKKIRKQVAYDCPAHGCKCRTKEMRCHAYISHLPLIAWIDEDNLPAEAERGQLLDLVKSIAEKIGDDMTLQRLINMINASTDFVVFTDITPGEQCLMRKLCKDNGWPLPFEFTLKPVNSPAVLVSWQVLLFLSNYLTEGQRKEMEVPNGHKVWMQLYKYKPQEMCGTSLPSPKQITNEDYTIKITINCEQSSESDSASVKSSPVKHNASVANKEVVVAQSTEEAPVINGSPQQALRVRTLPYTAHGFSMTPKKQVTEKPLEILCAMDSHFHQNRIAERLKLPQTMSVDALTEVMLNNQWYRQDYPSYRIELVGGVNVICDPEAYPSSFPEDSKYHVAVGIHPKKVPFFTAQLFSQLSQLLEHPQVVALGEIGLDHTVHPRHWRKQDQALDELLPLAPRIGKPVVLHMRGQYPNHIDDVGYDCLRKMKAHCPASQGVHLHCFNGNSTLVETWMRDFPNCYFGFTAVAKDFSDDQVRGLQAVPDDRLLLETDAPYFGRQLGVRTTAPAYIGDVAVILANIRGTSVKHVLETTVNNTRRLYGL